MNIRVTYKVLAGCEVEQFCYKFISKLAVYTLFFSFFALYFSFQELGRLSRLFFPLSNMQASAPAFDFSVFFDFHVKPSLPLRYMAINKPQARPEVLISLLGFQGFFTVEVSQQAIRAYLICSLKAE